MSDYRINAWHYSDFIGADACLAMDSNGRQQLSGFKLATDAHGFEVDVSNGAKSAAVRATDHQVMLGRDLTLGGSVYLAGSRIFPEFSIRTGGANPTTLIVAQIASPTSPTAGTKIVLTSSELLAGQQFAPQSVDTSEPGSAGKNCFARGTMIETPHGAQPIEQLEDGDEILASDGHVQQVLWAGRRRISGLELVLNPHLQPVRIMAGALTSGCPAQDLVVSQNQRLLVDDWRAPYLFGEDEILVPAKSLLNNNNVIIECPLGGVDYFHLLVQGQALVCANGLWAESMLPDVAELAGLSPVQQAEISHSLGNNSLACQAVLAALPHHSAASIAA